MLSLARYCRTAFLSIPTRQALISASQNVRRNSFQRICQNGSLWQRQPLIKNLKLSALFRRSGTVAVRLSSGTASKSKKQVGYWLLTCSGMVFVAVVLGIIVAYYVVLLSIFIVLDEVIKKTVK